jgi:hypothetical protein
VPTTAPVEVAAPTTAPVEVAAPTTAPVEVAAPTTAPVEVAAPAVPVEVAAPVDVPAVATVPVNMHKPLATKVILPKSKAAKAAAEQQERLSTPPNAQMTFRPITSEPLMVIDVPFFEADIPEQQQEQQQEHNTGVQVESELQQLSVDAIDDGLSATHEVGDLQFQHLDELFEQLPPPDSTMQLEAAAPAAAPQLADVRMTPCFLKTSENALMIAQSMKDGYGQLFMRDSAIFQTLAPSAPLQQVKVHLEHVLKVVHANPEIQWHDEQVRAAFFPESLLHVLGLALSRSTPLMPALPATRDLPPLPTTSHADRLRLYMQTTPRPENVFWSDVQTFVSLWDEWNHKKLWWICQQLKASPVYFSAVKDMLAECDFLTQEFVDQLYEESRHIYQRKRVAVDELNEVVKRMM